MKMTLRGIFISFVCLLATSGFAQNWQWARFTNSADYSFLGSADQGLALGTDAACNVVTTGFFENNIRFGTDTVRKLLNDATYFLVKHDSNGVLQWAKPYGNGGGGYNSIPDIDVDAQGYSVVAGNASGTRFYAYFDTFNSVNHGSGRMFVTKFDPAGRVMWLTMLGGPGTVQRGVIGSVTTSPAGDIYITGEIDQNCTFGPYSLTSMGSNNTMFIARLNSNGIVQWVRTTTGGIQYERSWGRSIVLAGDGYLYTCGNFRGNVTFDTITVPGTLGANSYIAKYNTNGRVIWVRWLKQNNTLNPTFNLDADQSGNVYFSGMYTDTMTISGTTNTFIAPVPQNKAFLMKLDSTGAFQWLMDDDGDKKFGGKVALDRLGYPYLTGTFTNTVHFGSYIAPTVSYQRQFFIEKMNPADASMIWVATAHAGSSCGAGAADLHLDATNHLVCTGSYGAKLVLGTDSNTLISYPTCDGGTFIARLSNQSLSIQNAGANGLCTGDTMHLTATSGFTQYHWSNGDTGQAIRITLTDTLTVWALSGTDTLRSLAYIARFDPRPDASFIVDSTICPGDTSHFINTSTVASGVMSYQWRFAFGQTSALQSPDHYYNSSGIYNNTLIVTSNSGCGDTVSHAVHIYPRSSAQISPAGPVTRCQGDSIVLSSSFTYPVYHWSTGDSTRSITIYGPGVLTMYGIDSNGCTTTISNSVTATFTTPPAQPQITLSGSSTPCAGDTVVLRAPAGYSAYEWSSGQSTASITVTVAGSYAVRVRNASGCWSVFSAATVLTWSAAPPKPLIALSDTNVFCQGDSVILSVPAGYSAYHWNTGTISSSLSVDTTGAYYVQVTDANGCKSPNSDTIYTHSQSTSAPVITADSGHLGFCDGDSVILHAPPGYAAYLWSDSSTADSIIVYRSGSYQVQVLSGIGCSSPPSQLITITVHPTPARPVIVASGPVSLCQGDSVILSATPGYSTYRWTDGATTSQISVTASGLYAVAVTDSAGCSSAVSDTIIVTVHTPPAAPLIQPAGTVHICLGDSAILSSSISAGISWSTGTTADSITVRQSGTYFATYTDTNHCSAQSIPTIVVADTIIPPVLSAARTVICQGDSMLICAQAGYSHYAWSGGDTVMCIRVRVAGSYSLTVSTQGGCSASASMAISVSDSFALSASVDSVHCYGGSDGGIDLTVSGSGPAYTYRWDTQDSTEDIHGLTAASYTVTVSDPYGCSLSASYQVTQPAPFAVSLAADSVRCYGQREGRLVSTVTGGIPAYSYLWNTSAISPTLDSMPAGHYTLIVTDAASCTASAGADIGQPDTLMARGVVSDIMCRDLPVGAIDLTVSGGTPVYSYLWSDSTTTEDLHGIRAGAYTVTITDAHGCTTLLTTAVALRAGLSIQVQASDPTCTQVRDGRIAVTASGSAVPFAYLWSDGSTGSSLSSLSAGSYAVTVSDSYGCTADSSVTLHDRSAITVSAAPHDVTIRNGESINIITTASGAVYRYTWTPAQYLSCSDCPDPVAAVPYDMDYHVHVTDTAGCYADDMVHISVDGSHALYVPDAFTPNGDGINDLFEIYGDKSTWKYAGISIFNRWGEKVFESNDIDFAWDGQYQHTTQQGVYVYQLTIVYTDNKEYTSKGSITLIR